MKKTFISLSVSLLVGSAMSMSAYDFRAGTGTTDDPYQIFTAEDLQHVSDYTSNSEVAFIVMDDIDLDGVDFQPIASPFFGVFDGNNHVISNFTNTSGNDGVGLFARVNTPAVIKNVIMEYADIVCNRWSGILISTNGNWEKDGGTVINCHVRNSNIDGGDAIGGLIGVGGGVVEGCSVENVSVVGGTDVGGLIGRQEAGVNYVHNCYFVGDVKGTNNVGGVIGWFRVNRPDGVNAEMYKLAAYGTVTSDGEHSTAAGIYAYQQGNSNIVASNLFSDVNVTSPEAGGIAGSPMDGHLYDSYALGNITANDGYWAGGIVGTCYNGAETIVGCYNYGSASGTTMFVGGVCGRNWPGIQIKGCYYNEEGSAKNMGEGHNTADFEASPLLPEAMLDLDNMPGLTAGAWVNNKGVTTPYLATQTAPATITECTTDGIKGTCPEGTTYLVIYTAQLGAVDKTVTIDGTSWEVTWNEEMIPNDLVYVIAKAGDLMPSQRVSMRMSQGSGVANIANENDVKVVSGKGYIKVEGATGTYKMYNVAGQCVKAASLNGEVINTSSLNKGIYMLVVNGKAHKVAVR